MIGTQANQVAREEGKESARKGKTRNDNPHDFRYDARAYFWEEGFKEGSK